VDTRARTCPSCGALNGADFDRCIRCNAALSKSAASAEALGRALDGRSLIGTKILLALTLLVFTGQFLATLGRGLGVPILSGGAPADAIRYGAIFVAPELVIAEPWRLLSAVFVHFGLLHIGLNMLALVQLSRIVEPAVGTSRFVLAYVTSGIVSFATTTGYAIVTHAQPSLTAGASGAIFGIMGVILGVLLRRRDPRWKSFAVQAVLFSLLLGFGANASHSGILVNNSAHLGGLVWGLLLGVAFAKRRGPSRAEWLVNAGAAISLAACVASLLLAQRSPLWHMIDRASAAREVPTAPARPERAHLSAPTRPG
jgi:membrane associated rhomboid family serine protease